MKRSAWLAFLALSLCFLLAALETQLGNAAPGAAKPPVKKLAVVDFYDIADVTTVREPKPLSNAVKKGLEWLAKQQNIDGGWTPTERAAHGPSSELGCSAICLMAFLRSGNSANNGPYQRTVNKGLAFLIRVVSEEDKAPRWPKPALPVSQIQSKLGMFADLFLANLALAEFRGKAGQHEHGVAVCLEKTLNKVLSLQTAEGRYRGNEQGWAPVLAMGLANKGVARARIHGGRFDDIFCQRAFEYSLASVLRRPARPDKLALGVPREEDAGVPLYRVSQGATNIYDIANAYRYELARMRLFANDPLEIENVKKAAHRAERLVQHFDGVRRELLDKLQEPQFVQGVGTIGGEELLSYWNVSEVLVLEGGEAWQKWDGRMAEILERSQDADGSWSGQHCLTSRVFCTAAAILVLTADRTPFPRVMLNDLRAER
ncbi:MAG: hypothetical protein RMI91_09720 [Gemmatales bacterium]|nr:hypothetical protein [Gemmatales bacterium]MDW7994918.1 hypothetical protein [Gemmatales bacterium]